MASSATGARLGTATDLLRDVSSTYVLIFNEGQPDEGVYTLQGRQTPTSYVLSFEASEEAARFADLLQAEGFDLAAPVEWRSDRIAEFCSCTGFELGFVPVGTLITPPENNSYDLDAYNQLAKETEKAEEKAEEAARDRKPATHLTKEIQLLEHLYNDL